MVLVLVRFSTLEPSPSWLSTWNRSAAPRENTIEPRLFWIFAYGTIVAWLFSCAVIVQPMESCWATSLFVPTLSRTEHSLRLQLTWNHCRMIREQTSVSSRRNVTGTVVKFQKCADLNSYFLARKSWYDVLVKLGNNWKDLNYLFRYLLLTDVLQTNQTTLST